MYYEIKIQVYTDKEEAENIHKRVNEWLKIFFPDKTAISTLFTTYRDETERNCKSCKFSEENGEAWCLDVVGNCSNYDKYEPKEMGERSCDDCKYGDIKNDPVCISCSKSEFVNDNYEPKEKEKNGV